MFIVQNRKIFFILSGVLLIVSLLAVFLYGFNVSIDFKGGTLTEVKYDVRPEQTEIEPKISALKLGGFSFRPSGESNYTIRTRELSQIESQSLVEVLGNPTVEKQTTIGPVAGAELKSKAISAVAVVILMIVLFITLAFHKVSKPVSSWKYGLATIIALGHDVIISTGAFVLFGRFYGFEIDLLFVTGLLAILGYSVHDTIVVFDRVRENLRINQPASTRGGEPTRDGELKFSEEFEVTIGKSINQTFVRSINTSVTIFITLFALYIFGSPATEGFSLLLIIGVVAGTYSSIFIASPLLVTFYKLQKNK